MILRSSVRASPAISGRQTVCRLYVARGVSVAPFCGDSDGGSGDCVEILMYNVKRWRYHAECRQWIPERVHGGRCGGFLAVMLSIICFADKKWRGSRKVYKIKGRTKCNEYEKFDTCSRKIAHCLSSSFLYNLFRNLIHVIILFLSLYLFLILFFIPGVCL